LPSRLRQLLRSSRRDSTFAGSAGYWEDRYAEGGDSGAGSYGHSAREKADFLNRFVAEHDVVSVIELGCGDGNQLALCEYQSYLGLDVSETAVERCRARFADDPTKSFRLVSEVGSERADLALSLDVIYHLVEDAVFDDHMRRLFSYGQRFVVVYSSNTTGGSVLERAHVRHRRFTDWVAASAPSWSAIVSPGSNAEHREAAFYAFAFVPGQDAARR
jgi:SAM-dependent methyltransferase